MEKEDGGRAQGCFAPDTEVVGEMSWDLHFNGS